MEFKSGKDEFHETSAHDRNSLIAKPHLRWWTEIPEVPHYRKNGSVGAG